MVPLEICKDQKAFLGWTDIIGPEVHLVFCPTVVFFFPFNWQRNSIMLHDRSMKTIYWTKDVTTSHRSIFNTVGATVALLLNLRCPTPMTVISDATKFGRLERKNALWVEDGALHEGRNMKLGLFLMTKFWVGSLFCLLFFDLWTHCSSSRMF